MHDTTRRYHVTCIKWISNLNLPSSHARIWQNDRFAYFLVERNMADALKGATEIKARYEYAGSIIQIVAYHYNYILEQSNFMLIF